MKQVTMHKRCPGKDCTGELTSTGRSNCMASSNARPYYEHVCNFGHTFFYYETYPKVFIEYDEKEDRWE